MVKGSSPKSMVGFAISLVLASALPAMAQEAGAPTGSAAPQAAAPQQAPAPSCSGLLCMLAPRLLAPRSAPVQPVVAPDPATAPATAATPAVDQAKPTDVMPVEPAAAKPRPRAKPIEPITIAAEPSEIGRLKTMASAMPKARIRIVGEGASDPDFAIKTAFDERRAGTDEARLFTEQMHVVAGGSIHSLGDLAGKVVSFGPDHSPSQTAGRKAFEALGIAVKEAPLELDNALDGLSTGDIDAVVVLAPQPVARLKGLTTPGLHLVSWPEGGALPAGAVGTSIDAADYPGLAGSNGRIAAMGVDAVLILRPRGTRHPATKAFLAALSHHSDTLARHGFDLLKAGLDHAGGNRFASAERR